jgi:hypothetical protein
MPNESITRTDLDDLLTKRENAILRWTIEVQLKFLAVQLALLSAFGGLILGGVYFIVAHVKPT